MRLYKPSQKMVPDQERNEIINMIVNISVNITNNNTNRSIGGYRHKETIPAEIPAAGAFILILIPIIHQSARGKEGGRVPRSLARRDPAQHAAKARVLGRPAAHGEVRGLQLGVDLLVRDGGEFLLGS